MDDARASAADSARRRATWRGVSGSSAESHDDDALADALAAEVAAVTASMPIITSRLSAADHGADDLFAALMDDPSNHDSSPVRAAPQAESTVVEDSALSDAPAFFDEVTVVDAPAFVDESSLVEESTPFAGAAFVADPTSRNEPTGVGEPVARDEPVPPEQPFLLASAPPPNGDSPVPLSYLPSEPPRYDPGGEEWRDLALIPPVGAQPTILPAMSEELADSGDHREWAPSTSAVPPPPPLASAPMPPQMTPPMPPRMSAPMPPQMPPRMSAPMPPPPSAPVAISEFLNAAPPPLASSVAVPPPGSALPEPPRLRSLDDDTLATVLNKETERIGVAGALAELEVQMQLREEDAREYESWERALRAIGTDEALSTIERVREKVADRFSIPAADAGIDGGTDDDAPDDHATDDHATDDHATDDLVPDDSAGYGAPQPGSTIDDVPDPDDAGVGESHQTGPRIEDVSTAAFDVTAEFDVPEATPTELTGRSGTADVPVDDGVMDSDDIDDTDWARIIGGDDIRVPEFVTSGEEATLAAVHVPPPAPVVHDDAPVLSEEAIARQHVFALETNNGEPTLLEYRAGRATRMFWQWFALNSSAVSVAVGAVVFGLGMSVRQALVAVLAGVALSLLPLGLSTLAGKWSGQPTMIVSRAAFGVVGNLLPAVLAVVSRAFWGAVILWVIGAGVAAGADLLLGSPSPGWVPLVAVAAALVIATLIALFGYALLIRVALVLGIASALLVVGLVALTASSLDIGAALRIADGSWVHVVTGAVLVFSVVGMAWANAGAEVARYQRPGGSGASAIGFTLLGTGLPAIVLLGYGVLLAASDPRWGTQLQTDPLAALHALLPGWYSIPLVAALMLSLLCGLALTLYSGAFSLQAAGVQAPRAAAVAVIAVGTGALAAALVGTADLQVLLRDGVTTLAVPVAAWAGIFACDLMIRHEHFDSAALMRRRSTYGDVNGVNVGMLLVGTVVGLGFTTATFAPLAWQGYLWSLLGVPGESALAASDLGVLVALALGLLTPLVSGVRRIRAQERAGR